MNWNPWLESAAVTLLAVAGVLLGRWFSRLRQPYWPLGYFIPLALALLYGAAMRHPALALVAPVSWMMMGRNKFAVIGFVATMVLTNHEQFLAGSLCHRFGGHDQRGGGRRSVPGVGPVFARRVPAEVALCGSGAAATVAVPRAGEFLFHPARLGYPAGMSLLPFDTLPPYKPRQFLPARIELGEWSPLAPFFDELESRAARCATAADLERWLVDWSELGAALDEEAGRRYIAMTCHTDNAEAEKA